MQPVTIGEGLKEATAQLKGVVERPRLEAELLLAHHMGEDRIWLHTREHERLPDPETFRALVTRRQNREPIEYITARATFYEIELEVGEGVLIPRPETELLVDRAAALIEREGLRRICEIGVGSGAISIMLARKFPDLSIVATDISEAALDYARRNIARYGLEGRITLQRTSFMDGVEGAFEMIVSNPPYIARNYDLPDPVRYEPEEALFGGEAGDEMLQTILSLAKARQVPYVACEMGYDQKASMIRFCRSLGWPVPRFYKDLAGWDRGFVLSLQASV